MIIGSRRVPVSEGDVRSRTSLGLEGVVKRLLEAPGVVIPGFAVSVSDGPTRGSSLISIMSPLVAGDCVELEVFVGGELSSSISFRFAGEIECQELKRRH
jgi:hypothetical protein